jgi:hypothetical protein
MFKAHKIKLRLNTGRALTANFHTLSMKKYWVIAF